MSGFLWPVLGAAIVVVSTGTAASAEPQPVTRADDIAVQLARDPVFITDEAPRDITPADAMRRR